MFQFESSVFQFKAIWTHEENIAIKVEIVAYVNIIYNDNLVNKFFISCLSI